MITVKQLIEHLQKFPQDSNIYLEAKDNERVPLPNLDAIVQEEHKWMHPLSEEWIVDQNIILNSTYPITRSAALKASDNQ